MNDTEYKKAKSLFKPHSAAMMRRQSVYKILGEHPTKAFSIQELASEVGEDVSRIYAACKVLCMNGLARRTKISTPRKMKPEEAIFRTGVQHVDNWAPGVKKEW